MSQAASGSVPGASGAFAEALQWAAASAAMRGAGRLVTEPDLFLGTLLAHPDADGEMRRLIGHFGVTARDLLPDDFPKITLEGLRYAAATIDPENTASLDQRVTQIVSAADRLASNRPPILADLVGALLSESQFFRLALQRPLDRSGLSVSVLADRYSAFLGSLDPVKEIAGKVLGAWLARNFPRQPASLAAFSSDVVEPTADFVDVGIEADAFAYLISSRTLVPPLAIGLFGQWGSGKSFLMAKIRHRIKQLSGLARSTNALNSTVWPNVAHIEFNAWEYVETNLWASLLDKIFEELSPEARQKLSDRRRKGIVATLDAKKNDVVTAERTLTDSRAAESHAADAVQKKQDAFDTVVRTTSQLRDDLITRELESGARAALVQTVVAVGKEEFGAEVTAAVADVRRAAVATRTGPWLQPKFWTGRRVVYVALAAAVVPVLAFVMDALSAPPIASVLASLAPLVPLAALAIKAAATFATNQQQEWAAAARKVDDLLAAAVIEVKDSLTTAGETLRAKQDAVATAEAAVGQARDEQAQLERKRDALTVGSTLVEFLADRRASEDYRSHLGLISKVHQDLEDLAELTADFNLETPQTAGGPPNRIVLYIDDLDRCPPRKVVQVLEAVHLLLSFPLFVVVVAVDTRWLRSALHDALPALAARPDQIGDQPKAMDYVEKIFQFPFWVEELDDDARRRLVRGLLLPSTVEVAAEARGGANTILQVGPREEELVTAMLTDFGSWLDPDARQLALTVEELAFIESLAPLMGGTPRRVKRFVNICQLLLAMAPPLATALPSDGDQPSERMAACFMAALHESSPGFARRLVEVSAGLPANLPVTLQTTLAAFDPVELTVERERLRAWLRKRQQLASPGAVPFESTPMDRFLLRFGLIRRLTFEAEAVAGTSGNP